MYIAPNTVIKIIKNCPLDNTYTHTIYFNDVASQIAYFSGLAKYTLTQQTYQRVNKGVMRVQYKAEDLYDCNYLMFQNSSFGNKWFYAFIKSVEYVNNITSEITFELDIMQTWFFDYELQGCFVDREHSATDNIGENTVPENLEIGDYIESGSGFVYPEGYVPGGQIVFVTSFNNDETLSDVTEGTIINGVYCALKYHFFSALSDGNAADSFVQRIIAANKWDGVLAIYMSPFVSTGATGTGSEIKTEVTISKNYGNLAGYVPKNKKLFTYPYNLLHVYTDTNSADFKYEFFNVDPALGDVCTFDLLSAVVPSPTLCLIPTGYLNYNSLVGYGIGERQEHRLTISEYPQCAIVGDVYKIYLAQNAASLPTKMIGSAVQATTRIATTAVGETSLLNPAKGVAQAAQIAVDYAVDTANTLAQLYDISTKPPQVNGTQTSACDWAIGVKNFNYSKLCIRPEFARIIDGYFSMYGYATHRVKVPNRAVRQQWTYTKTKGCTITGSIPCDDMNTICNIYDRGITFWRNGNNVGNYSLSNNPI